MATNICTLYIVRHGQSVFNRDKLLGGQANPALTEQGRQEALVAKAGLTNAHFDDVYSSDLIRASETAELMYGKPVPQSHQLTDLRERNYGRLQGKSHADYQRLRDEHQERYNQLPEAEQWLYKYADDIESDHELSVRFMRGLKKIADKNMGKTVLVVAHGGCVRALLARLQYINIKELPPGSFKNAGYVELVYDGMKFQIRQVSGAKESAW